MGVSQSTYYYQPKVPRKVREQTDAELRDRIEVLQEYESVISMSAKGKPYDNAYAGSFFKTLQKKKCTVGNMRALSMW